MRKCSTPERWREVRSKEEDRLQWGICVNVAWRGEVRIREGRQTQEPNVFSDFVGISFECH